MHLAKITLAVFIQTLHLAYFHCFPFPICCESKDLRSMLDTHQLSAVPLPTSEMH